MPVPKTSVYENDFTSGREHHVGFARKFPDVKAVAVAHAVNKAADYHLRFGVRSPDQAHARAALLWAEGVHMTL